MGSFVFVLWFIGLAGAGVLNVVVGSNNPRIVRVGRFGFAVLLAVELFAGAVIFTIGESNSNPDYRTTQSMWWLFALGGGVPIALLSGFAVRRAYVGHRLVLWSAVLLTAALWLAFPFGFSAADQKLQGLARFEHNHHALDVALLLLPTLILLVAEAFRHDEATDAPTIAALLRSAPRKVVVGVVIVLVAFLWFAGASPAVFWLGVAVLIVGGGIVIGVRNRAAVRQMRRDLE